MAKTKGKNGTANGNAIPGLVAQLLTAYDEANQRSNFSAKQIRAHEEEGTLVLARVPANVMAELKAALGSTASSEKHG